MQSGGLTPESLLLHYQGLQTLPGAPDSCNKHSYKVQQFLNYFWSSPSVSQILPTPWPLDLNPLPRGFYLWTKSMESFDKGFSAILYLPIIKHFISRGKQTERLKITLNRSAVVATNEYFLKFYIISTFIKVFIIVTSLVCG